jgi:hypothetical protein
MLLEDMFAVTTPFSWREEGPGWLNELGSWIT